jgi:hypothetical protein
MSGTDEVPEGAEEKEAEEESRKGGGLYRSGVGADRDEAGVGGSLLWSE